MRSLPKRCLRRAFTREKVDLSYLLDFEPRRTIYYGDMAERICDVYRCV